MSTNATKARLDRTTPDNIHSTVSVAGRLPAFDSGPRILAIEAAALLGDKNYFVKRDGFRERLSPSFALAPAAPRVTLTRLAEA